METSVTRQEALDKLAELIKDINIAMLTTIEADGNLHSRPMATIKPDKSDGTLWFFTNKDSAKVDEVRHDDRVSLSYAEPGDNCYVAVSGTARLVHDRAKMEELWNPLYRAWFPEGLDDPHLALLKVSAERAEYWDAPSSKMVQLYGFVKAIATGQTYDAGEHERIKL